MRFPFEPNRAPFRAVYLGMAAQERSAPPREDLLEASFRDIRADLEELAGLVRSSYAALIRARGELDRARPHVRRPTLRAVEDEVAFLLFRYRAVLDDLEGLASCAARGPWSEDLLARMARRRLDHADLVRSLAGQAAALITATDWQSPSFLHATRSMAGRHTGRVTEHVDDYKRDRHPDALEFEEAFLRAYVDPAPGWDLVALMTSCGMSAFATVLGFLAMEGVAPRRAVMGGGVYHECRDLIARSALGRLVVEADETETDGLLSTIERERPDVVFLDSLANAKGIAVPDLGAVAGRLARQAASGRPAWLVVDNTGLSVTCQPYALIPDPPPGLEVIVFESLTKYAQFGLDRTTAGMIVASRRVAGRLSGYREHLGTNVADTSVHVIPRPDRRAFEQRLGRLGRNAAGLAAHLQGVAEDRGGFVFDGVTYPGLGGHPSHGVVRDMPFHGGFLSIGFAPGHDTYEMHHRFVKSALYEAERVGVPLAAGASFGLDTTRVYLTASTSELGEPFVRISAGTEHRLGVEALKEVFTAAMLDLVAG